MSKIQIDNGYLIITADEVAPNVSGICAVSDSNDGCDISFDTEKAAEDAMDQLAEALCGKWLDANSGELLS